MSAFFLSKQHWDAPWSVRMNNRLVIRIYLRTLHGASLQLYECLRQERVSAGGRGRGRL